MEILNQELEIFKQKNISINQLTEHISSRNLLTGKIFLEGFNNSKITYSKEKCIKYKYKLNGIYFGFSTLKFGKSSFIIYSMKFDTNSLIFKDTNIIGKFTHSIYNVILNKNDEHDADLVKYAYENSININKECIETFEAIWFPIENRLFAKGIELTFKNGKIAIGKENYNLYITEKYIIGKWAFRYGKRTGITTPDIILSDTDVFTEHIHLNLIDDSELALSQYTFKKNLEYISILDDNNHSKCINGTIWKRINISDFINNYSPYNNISNYFPNIIDAIKIKYYDNGNDIIEFTENEFKIIIYKEKKKVINLNDLIHFDNIFFTPYDDSSLNKYNIGLKWYKINKENICAHFANGHNLNNNEKLINYITSKEHLHYEHNLNMLSLNKDVKYFFEGIKLAKWEFNECNIDTITEYDYICHEIRKVNDIDYIYYIQYPDEEDIVIKIYINNITNIKQIEQKFECTISIVIEWLPNKNDLYSLLYNDNNYKPSWVPREISFKNMYEIKSKNNTEPMLKKINGKYKNYITYDYNISFIDEVELDNFPFDIQDLEIKLKLPKVSNNCNITWIIKDPNKDIVNNLSEWKSVFIKQSAVIQQYNNGCINNINNEINIHIYVKRNYMIYIWRIIVTMSLITFVSFFNIGICPIQDLGDRISYSVTLFLTAIAYSIVTSSYLPILGKQTLMDWYIFQVYIYLGINMGLISLIPYYNDEEFILKYDKYIHYIFLIIWFIWHLIFFLRVKFYIIKKEVIRSQKYSNILFTCKNKDCNAINQKYILDVDDFDKNEIIDVFPEHTQYLDEEIRRKKTYIIVFEYIAEIFKYIFSYFYLHIFSCYNHQHDDTQEYNICYNCLLSSERGQINWY